MAGILCYSRGIVQQIFEPTLIAETDRWVVLDKPSGWLSIAPTHPGEDGAPILSEWARAKWGELLVVHRLDRETSGVILFAKTAADHREACGWFEQRRVSKEYDCLAVGKPMSPILKLSTPIRGKPAISQVDIRDLCENSFLARVRPVTGRRHQIRIHLAGAGFPLWGDTTYGGPASVSIGGRVLAIRRVALHAARLELPGREIYESKWPSDFASWARALREGSIE